MRIIGGKDYYDGIVGFDTDATRVFARSRHTPGDPQEHGPLSNLGRRVWLGKKNDRYYGDINQIKDGDVEHTFGAIAVIFAGKLYRGVHHRAYNQRVPATYGVTHYYWKPEALESVIDPLGLELKNGRWWDSDPKPSYFQPVTLTGAAYDYLLEAGIVVAITDDRYKLRNDVTGWDINCDGLKNIGFASLIDPWNAYQELDMFVGTILVKDEDKQVKLSDKSLIVKHGFDEVSFRNTHHRGKPRGQKDNT